MVGDENEVTRYLPTYLLNSSILDPCVRDAIEAKGCLLRFLPPYSPDYSPVELTFGLLKAWMRRHFRSFRELFQGDIGEFLAYIIENRRCD